MPIKFSNPQIRELGNNEIRFKLKLKALPIKLIFISKNKHLLINLKAKNIFNINFQMHNITN